MPEAPEGHLSARSADDGSEDDGSEDDSVVLQAPAGNVDDVRNAFLLSYSFFL